MEKALVIVRGLPGAGKNAFAKMLNTKAICSADDYFLINGEYKWSHWKLDAAHRWCERKCEKFMKVGAESIVIANTSVLLKDFKYYIDLAEKYDYKVFSVIIENRHDGVNSHNVGNDVIEKMRKKFEIQL
jgi:predicted kinase